MDAFRKIFQLTQEDVNEVRAMYGKTESDIKTDIGILKEWLKKQPHLPQDDDDERLERFLLGNKFRIEKTKSKIDSCYRIRGIHRDIFDKFDPSSELIRNLRQSCFMIPSPKLTPEKYRVFTWKFQEDSHLFTLYGAVVYTFLVFELQQNVDYNIGCRMIFDCRDMSLNAFKTFNVNILNKYFILNKEAFTGRLAGLHYVNAPGFMSTLVEMLKLACGPKEFSKIKVHENLESLYKEIPKECIIKELGGELDTLKIHNQLGDALVANKDLILKQTMRISNEALRIGDVVKNEQFGVEGTFKSLNLD